MKKLTFHLTLLILFTTTSYATSSPKFSDEACDKFINSEENNVFNDADWIYSCNAWVDKKPGSEIYDKEFNQRYPTLNLTEIHKLAKVNEFKAQAKMGKKYFFMNARFKRVSKENNSLMFEVYNGGNNQYISDRISVPLEVYREKLSKFWIWNHTIQILDDNLANFKDGDILTFICSSKHWRVRSPYAEDFGGCVFWDYEKS